MGHGKSLIRRCVDAYAAIIKSGGLPSLRAMATERAHLEKRTTSAAA